MGDTTDTARRCRCGHTRLVHRRLRIVVCPACDLVGSWPKFRKGSWLPL